MDSTAASALTITLRNGAACVLRDGALTAGDVTIPLSELASAGLVADVSVPVAPGMPPAPAVALRLANGALYFLTPLEQSDALRLLQAIYAARPDLAQPGPAAPPSGPGYGTGPAYPPPSYATGPNYGPPPPGYGAGPSYGPPPYGAPAYPGYPPYATGPTDSDRTMAGLAHLSVFFAPVILPLIFWLAMRQSHPYTSQQAKQAFWFHLFMSVISFVVLMLFEVVIFSTVFNSTSFDSSTPTDPFSAFGGIGFILGFYGILGVVGLLNAIFSVIGAVKAFQGKPFHYPLLGWI